MRRNRSEIQRCNELLVDEKRNDANEGDAFFAYPRLFVGVACDNDFAEGVTHAGQRKSLICHFQPSFLPQALGGPIKDWNARRLRRIYGNLAGLYGFPSYQVAPEWSLPSTTANLYKG